MRKNFPAVGAGEEKAVSMAGTQSLSQTSSGTAFPKKGKAQIPGRKGAVFSCILAEQSVMVREPQALRGSR